MNKLKKILNDPIARRYFIMNFFDGIMTSFGLIVGGANSIGASAPIIKAGIGASLAIAVSGFFGAYMAEKAERSIELKKLEHQMLRKLKNTRVSRRHKQKTLQLALIDAFSPFVGGILPLVPFILNLFTPISFTTALITSFILSLILLVGLGYYIGKLIGEKPWLNALLFGVGGLIIGLITRLLESLI